MIWIIITGLSWSAVSGETEYCKMLDRKLYGEHNKQYLEYSNKWQGATDGATLNDASAGDKIKNLILYIYYNKEMVVKNGVN